MNHRLRKLSLFIAILAMMSVSMGISGYAETGIIQPLSELTVSTNGFSSFVNNRAFYQITLTVNDLNVAKYVIEREQISKPSSRIKLAELTYTEMAQKQFQYIDSYGLEKHGQYQYIVYTVDQNGNQSKEVKVDTCVQNIRLKVKAQDYLPEFTQNNAMFVLGPLADPENETLEYRLYTRIPNGGGEKLLKTWRPTVNHERVIVNLDETCEWKLVCIETEANIPDCQEIVLVNWSLFVKS